jgi:FtsP/CotA-like multicopper oxidase with cupredoxin domain
MVDPRWTRRQALERGALSIGAVCLLGNRAITPVKRTSAGKRVGAAAAATPFQAELPIPPTLLPVSSTAAEDVYELTVREGQMEIIPNRVTPVYGYDGIFPGPTIRARKGRAAVVKVTNGVAFDQNVHLHGGFVPAASDGHPHDVIAPGGAFEYRYPNAQDAATLWYHDHAHGLTSRTLYFGVSGFYLLEDELEAELELPQGDYDVPLMISDRSFEADGRLKYVRDIDQGFLGDTILVNGAVSPRMAVERAVYRLRFLNQSNARQYRLELGGGEPMLQIAGDGGLLAEAVPRNNVLLAPAERVDVLVDFRGFKAGTQLRLTNGLGAGGTGMVMRFDVTGRRPVSGALPQRLRPKEAIPAPVADRTWELNFGSASSEWQIAGKGFDMERVDVTTQLGTTERWKFANTSHRAHPMHLHGVHFRVLERSRGPVNAGDKAWKDTVWVRTEETVTVQPRFGPYPGRYVFHCHNLEHQDRAMMLQMEIARNAGP